MTVEQLISKLENGYVINRKDLKDTLIYASQKEYERGCRNMILKYSDIIKRRREIREKRKRDFLNHVIQQLSDEIYEKRQKKYYGENYKRNSNKRIRGVFVEKVYSTQGVPDKENGNKQKV